MSRSILLSSLHDSEIIIDYELPLVYIYVTEGIKPMSRSMLLSSLYDSEIIDLELDLP